MTPPSLDDAVCLVCGASGLHVHTVASREEVAAMSDQPERVLKLREAAALENDEVLEYWQDFSAAFWPGSGFIWPDEEHMERFLDWLTDGAWSARPRVYDSSDVAVLDLFRRKVVEKP